MNDQELTEGRDRIASNMRKHRMMLEALEAELRVAVVLAARAHARWINAAADNMELRDASVKATNAFQEAKNAYTTAYENELIWQHVS